MSQNQASKEIDMDKLKEQEYEQANTEASKGIDAETYVEKIEAFAVLQMQKTILKDRANEHK